MVYFVSPVSACVSIDNVQKLTRKEQNKEVDSKDCKRHSAGIFAFIPVVCKNSQAIESLFLINDRQEIPKKPLLLS